MSVLTGNFKNELQKLFMRPKYMLFLLLELLICLLSMFVNTAVIKLTYGDAAEAAAGIPVNMLYTASLMFVPVVVFIAAGDMFSGERYDYSLQVLLVRPISKMKIYVSKIMALLVITAMFLLGMLVSSFIMELAVIHTVENSLSVAVYYALNFVPLITVVLFAAFINQFSSNAGMSIFMCTVILLGVYALQVFVPFVENFVFTKYLIWHTLWAEQSSLIKLAQAGIVTAAYDIIFFIAGYFKFETLEI